MIKKGSSLIECMLYIMMSMLIIALMSQVVLSAYQTTQRSLRTNGAALSLGIALQLLADDLKKEPCKLTILSNRCCIMRRDTHAVAWLQKKNRLMRYVGQYRSSSRSFSTFSASCITQVTDSNFSYQEGLVTIKLTKSSLCLSTRIVI